MTNKFALGVEEAVSATGGELLYGSQHTSFSSVSIDSRTTVKGDLFVAVIGAAHDGHTHAVKGVTLGQKGLIINRSNPTELPHEQWRQAGYFCIAVEDTTRALGDLAAFLREKTQLPVVAITGSNGKTSTRRMTTAVVRQKFDVLATQGNFNNEIGLPLTLLKYQPANNLAVLELGMNHFGEIRRLAQICRPDIGVITNVGPAHLEGLGSLEGVAQAKGELLESLRPGAKVVLNQDDPYVRALADRCPHKVLFFGFSESADIRAESPIYEPHRTLFTLRLPHGSVDVTLNVPGKFMVANALAASACGFLMGVSPQQISTGLANFVSRSGRMDIVETPIGIHLIDDTYNANPASMAAALELLSEIRGKQRSFFVCGDMYELGQQAEELHQSIGAQAARIGLNGLYATGRFSANVAQGALQEGMLEETIFTGTKKEIISRLIMQLQSNDWVLVKGSRAMAMETISDAIKRLERSHRK